MKKIFIVACFLATYFGYSQKYNCDVLLIERGAYDYAIIHLDSLKKHTPSGEFTVEAKVGKGKVQSLEYYTDYATDKQKKATPWKDFNDNMRVLLSLCPDSYYRDTEKQLNTIIINVPLDKKALEDLIWGIDARTGYYKPGKGYLKIAEDAAYTIDLKALNVSGNALQSQKLSGNLKNYSTGILKLTDELHMVFKVEASVDPQTVYFSYKIIETINYKAVVITEEKYRLLLNGGGYVKSSGKRENDGIPVLASKDFSVEFSIKFE